MIRWATDWLLDWIGCTPVGSVVMGRIDKRRRYGWRR